MPMGGGVGCPKGAGVFLKILGACPEHVELIAGEGDEGRVKADPAGAKWRIHT